MHRRTSVYRADLLRALLAELATGNGDVDVDVSSLTDPALGEPLAQVLGFSFDELRYRQLFQAPDEPLPPLGGLPATGAGSGGQDAPAQAVERPLMHLYAVTRVSPPREPDEPTAAPDLGATAPLQPSELEPTDPGWVVKMPPLAPWQRLWQPLRKLLKGSRRSGLDLPKILGAITANRVMYRLPRRSKAAWPQRLTLILDIHVGNRPFWDDAEFLTAQLARWVGVANLRVIQVRGPVGVGHVLVSHGAGAQVSAARQPRFDWLAWSSLRWAPDEAVLVVGDIGPGALSNDQGQQAGFNGQRQGERVLAWQAWWQAMMQRGLDPVLLGMVPCELPAARAWLWDERQGLRPMRAGSSAMGSAAVPELLQSLLAMLAIAVRVEPEVLRGLRQVLLAHNAEAGVAQPGLGLAAALEQAAWCAPEVSINAAGLVVRAAFLPQLRQRFAGLKARLQRATLEVLTNCHRGLAPEINHEEVLTWLAHASPQAVAALRQDADGAHRIGRAQRYLRAFQHELVGDDGVQHGLTPADRGYAARVLGRADPGLIATAPEAYQAYAAAVCQPAWAQGRAFDVPEGIDPQKVAKLLAGARRSQLEQDVAVYQRGASLVAELGAGDAARSPGACLARLRLRSSVLQATFTEAGEQPVRTMWSVEHALLRLGPWPAPVRGGRLEIDTGVQRVEIAGIAKPSWASAFGRDEYGVFADFEVPYPRKGEGICVTQRCRWIPAGTFWMGSPESERGRFNDETQNQVTLTEGFWLADTACTQALWQVVMGSNPSRFQGKEAGTSQADEHPVEQVSWDDIASGFHGSAAAKIPSFLQKLNDLVPGLNAGLPSEAQWEWACRADPSGSKASKPYHWGDDISTELANFSGKPDWNDEAPTLGKPLGRTTFVKAYQPNLWGLHQMHGNVWEWCRDWQGSYEDRPQVDPEGPPSGSERVLRGGSWLDRARDLRSATRDGYAPAYRRLNIGFRLAPGQSSPAG